MLCSILSICQPPRNTNPSFSIGNKIPALNISNVLNHQSGSLNLDEYNHKLLILDFMGTSCISCLRALPRFDSLQSQFGKRLQVVLVTPEKKERVSAFLKTKRAGQGLCFPVITEDSILEAWFPHQFISHLVWINDGKVVAITGSQYVDDNNIGILLSGRPLHLPRKKDMADYNYSRPLLTFTQLPEEDETAIKYYSGFRSALPDIPHRFLHTVDSAAGTQRLLIINYSLTEIFLKSYGLPVIYPQKWMQLNVADTSRFIYDPGKSYRQEWRSDNSYCYEAVLPISLSAQQYMDKLRSDVSAYFGFSSRIEKRDTAYLIISQNSFPQTKN